MYRHKLVASLLLQFLLGTAIGLPLAASAEDKLVNFSIKQQSLASSLNEYAKQANVQLLVAPELVAGKTAPAINQQTSPSKALQLLLKDSGLQASQKGESLIVSKATAPNLPKTEETLPEINVAALTEKHLGGGFSVKETSLGVLGQRALMDTPYSINVINQELITNMGMRDLKDIVRADASVSQSFSSAGYYDAINIRGFNLNNWTNYYKNGLLFANQAKTALENIERVEIQRGLTGMLQGFAAPGGSINYVTKRPTATWQTRLNTYMDNHGTFVPHLDVGGPLTDDGRLGVRFNLAGGNEFFNVDDVKTRREFGSAAIDWKPTDQLVIKFDAELDSRKGNTQPLLMVDENNRLPRNVDPTKFLGQSWQTYNTRTRQYGLSAEWAFSDNWLLELKANNTFLYRDDYSANIDNIRANGNFDVYEYKSSGEERRSRNTQIALRGFLSHHGIKHDLTLGVAQRNLDARFGDGVYQAIGVSNLYNPVKIDDPGTRDPDAVTAIRNQDRGIFVSDFITFNDYWQALVGLRTAKVEFESIFDPAIYEKTITTPTYALIFKPVQNVSLYASYIEGLQQGNTAPLFAVNRNQQLSPQVSKQKEVGIKTELYGGRITAGSSLFEIEQDLSYVDPATNIFGYNGLRRHRGIEFSLAGELWEGGRLSSSALFMDPKALDTGNANFDDKIPSGVARNQATLWIDQKLPIAGLSAQFGTRYSSRRAVNADNSVFAPSWTVFDIGMRYATKIQNHNVNLGLQVLNVTDKEYFVETGSGLLNFGLTRTVRAQMQFEF